MPGLDRAPRQTAQAVDLAALHGERDLVGARVAGYQLDRRTEHVLIEARENVRLRAWPLAAERRRFLQEIVPGLHRRGVPGDAGRDVVGDAAEPGELGAVEGRAAFQQRIDAGGAGERSDRAAVLR